MEQAPAEASYCFWTSFETCKSGLKTLLLFKLNAYYSLDGLIRNCGLTMLPIVRSMLDSIPNY